MADTHLSIETTYIAYPICYTMMLPNMPFRKADAHPLRLNTRCKDLTLVPSMAQCWISNVIHVVNRMIITHMDPYGLIAPPNGLTKALGDAVPLKYQ